VLRIRTIIVSRSGCRSCLNMSILDQLLPTRNFLEQNCLRYKYYYEYYKWQMTVHIFLWIHTVVLVTNQNKLITCQISNRKYWSVSATLLIPETFKKICKIMFLKKLWNVKSRHQGCGSGLIQSGSGYGSGNLAQSGSGNGSGSTKSIQAGSRSTTVRTLEEKFFQRFKNEHYR
jgi:hypothetical protein